MKTKAALLSMFATSLFAATVPEVSSVIMSQNSARLVTVTYALKYGPAVITMDIETNAQDGTWASIGGAAVCNAQGDVWKKVETDKGTITWRPDLSWPEHKIEDGGARAVVTAWPLDNPPDYMVVDISTGAAPNTQRYFPAVDFLPGGLLENDIYRTSSLVLRKIMAKDVVWTMGSTMLETQRNSDGREDTHQVKLDSNYYMGVFQFTQAQWALVRTTRPWPSYFSNVADRAMRPVERVSYNEIRNNTTNSVNAAYDYPADPHPGSVLGILRTRTGIAFDLPGEAQWEFAARAGHGDTKWGDGSAILNTAIDANLSKLGRYSNNVSVIPSKATANTPASEGGTAIVGSYAPNDWGLYDMHGNLWDWCLDWWAVNISSLGGAVNSANIEKSTSRSRRGGEWYTAAATQRPAQRNGSASNKADSNCFGFRVVCPVDVP